MEWRLLTALGWGVDVQEGEKDFMIKLGVNTVLFGKHDFRTAMQHIKWAGYDAAEISALKGMCEHLCLDTWKKDAADIKAISQDLELPITAMEEGGLDENRLMLAYEAGAEIGIPVVNVGPGGSKDNPEDLSKTIDILAKMAEKAEPFGVKLCVKAHVGAAIWNTPTTIVAMAKIASPAFGIDMDPSHIHRGGEVPKDALRQVISRVKHVHIRDCKGPGPSPGAPEMQACGRGEIDLMGYCKVLVESKFDGPVNLEIIGAGEYELSRCAIIAAESYGYLNACLKACGGR
ncbi:MAG TPA: sugar phosphate isomerase/epimerase [Candidatus Hydrogenedentes bacterium]|nr:sugar phosphate isomerase/epimerase [Candidatus Hydrogenedentota bacterium]HOV75974.1 sugar phosphate isomerase/epimerase [Candidatus Hydrogenedentota bacterium]HPC16826.1 sugar phosphate isomerase/epimerase [Candidatus Hydrogenedentota bacterium]HRT21351.1 sugar phosphate isomerase/epimerase [Candidatus Hydrogenedentota bacterium]HRT66114.1 sugar phosphate isomerase/epimerase [Candidatus Hydrogenedentota bacterium]